MATWPDVHDSIVRPERLQDETAAVETERDETVRASVERFAHQQVGGLLGRKISLSDGS